MGVVIDQNKCIGCGSCMRICPGNLIRTNAKGKAYLKKERDCWSCTSCMKECPVKAIALVLSPEMGGRGAKFAISKKEKKICWTAYRDQEVIREIITDPEESNKY